jgi:cellulose synthase operon protein C
MARGIGGSWLTLASLFAIWLMPLFAYAEESPAMERFRAAAALQERELFDLAVAEYEAISQEHAADPLASRARLQLGICLFQLGRFEEARMELSGIRAHAETLSHREQEQLLAFLGLAEFNASHIATDAARKKLLDASIDSLGNQLTQFPNGSLAERSSFYRAEALYARGQLAAATVAYRETLARYPQHPQRADLLYALGVVEQESGEFIPAATTFNLFATLFPQHASAPDARQRRGQVLLTLAESQFQSGQHAESLKTIELLLAEFSESAFVPRALLVRAGIEAQDARAAAAEATLDRCLARSTDPQVSHEARLLRATVRHSRGSFAGGFADAQTVLAAEPNRIAALHVRASCEMGLHRPLDAVKTLTAIINGDPGYPAADRALCDLAWAHHEANELEHANACYARLIAAFPRSPFVAECHYRLGEAQYVDGDFAAAAEHFQSALRSATDPALIERATHKLAWCQFEQGNFTAAQATFERQVAQISDSALAADARIMAAECRFQQQAFADALPLFTAALARPDASESLRSMALAHAAHAAGELGQWQQAIDFANRSLSEFPHSQWSNEARCELGVALLETTQLDDAERELTAVLAASKPPLSLRAEFALGRVYLARNQTDEAVRTFFKVAYGHGGPKAPASYHHWQAEAIYAAAQALDGTARAKSAEKLYQELVDNYPASPRATTARQSLDRILRR